MAWNTPSGNQDILYFIFTLYNITSTRAADYVGVRPAMREILLEKAREFQERNNAAFGVTLRRSGLSDHRACTSPSPRTWTSARLNANYASVNIPFALGYTYKHDFPQPDDWTFDPAHLRPSVLPGDGLCRREVPPQPARLAGPAVGLTVFGTFATFPAVRCSDPHQLGPALSLSSPARPIPPWAIRPCNTGDPKATPHLLHQQESARRHAVLPVDRPAHPAARRLSIDRGGLHLRRPRGDARAAAACDVTPGDPTILGDAGRMAAGVNAIDSMTGYQGFNDPNGDGRVEQNEFEVVPGVAPGEGAGGAGGVRQRVPGPLDRARSPGLLPGSRAEPGDGDLAAVGDRDGGGPVLRTRQPADRDRRQRPTCSTTRTIASSTWKATGSIAAGSTRPASCSSSPSSTMPTP